MDLLTAALLAWPIELLVLIAALDFVIYPRSKRWTS